MLSIIKPIDNYTCDYKLGNKILKKDIEYVINTNWAKELNLNPIKIVVPNYTDEIDLSNKKLLIIRAMGAGDMLFLSPVIQLLKLKYPTCKIAIACIKEQHELVNLIKDIDECVEYPIEKSIFDSFDHYLQIAQIIEGNPENNEKNIYQAYFDSIAANTVSEGAYRPIIKKELFENIQTDPKLIGIHPFANDPIRCLNLQIIKELYKKLKELKYDPIIIGTKEEYNRSSTLSFIDGFNWSFQQYPSYTLLAKLVAKCRWIISTDSLVTHLAQGLGVETICFYGPFSSNSRVKSYKNIHIFDSNPSCRCFMHQLGKCKIGFPEPVCLKFDINSVISIIENKKSLLNDVPQISFPQIEYYGIENE